MKKEVFSDKGAATNDPWPIGVKPLDDFCREHPKVALAFSGGCDSAYTLSVLSDAGVEVKAYYVETVFQPKFELEDAYEIAELLGANLEVIKAEVLGNEKVCANDPRRCYWCKHFIFGTIIEHMKHDDFNMLVDGTNASDDPLRRPGFQALAELGVLSPLRLAGFTKEEVRNASRKRGLPTADKPSFSCLATKVEEGTCITAEALEAVRLSLSKTMEREI